MNQRIIEPVYLSPEEAWTLLGLNESAYYRYVRPFVLNKTIRVIQVGRSVRINRASLLEWAATREETYTRPAEQ